MPDSYEYDGLIRGMGDVVFDETPGESLYHYNNQPEDDAPPRPERRGRASYGMGQAAPTQPATQAQTQAPVSATAADVGPKRGLKTPFILGIAAGGVTAAGVYGYMRWVRQDEEGAARVAGVAGGTSGAGVLLTILVARGLGVLEKPGKA